MLNDHRLDDEYAGNEFPLAYLITFRTFGTWLHGDERGSVTRQPKSIRESKRRDINIPLRERMTEKMDTEPVVLDRTQRKVVQDAIREVCHHRGYVLYALNVRSNHGHVVVHANAKPERVSDSMKGYATRRLRELGLVDANQQIWSRGRSRRYLWKSRHVEAAVDYVLYCQSDVPFELDD